MSRFEENLATLKDALAVPLLGVVPHNPANGYTGAAEYLQLPG
jgi:dethiobiotin synthetase